LTEVEAHLRACPTCAANALSRLQLKRMNEAVGRRFFPRPECRLKTGQSISAAKGPRWARGWVPKAFGCNARIVSRPWVNSRTFMFPRWPALTQLTWSPPTDIRLNLGFKENSHLLSPCRSYRTLHSSLSADASTTSSRVPEHTCYVKFENIRFSVFIFRNRAELNRLNSGSSSLRRELAFNSETWAEGGLRYFVVGDASTIMIVV
jgi:hypothetical protein